MRTIEDVRLQNFKSLVEEVAKLVKRAPTDGDLAAHLGISKVYAWQLRNEKRKSIDGKAARKMEEAIGKHHGWMDTDFQLWPFPGIDPSRLEGLLSDQKIEIQGLVRDRLEKFEKENAARKVASSEKRRAA